MSAFLLLLVKVNLAMGAAVVLVWLLRRPLRASFGAPIAYAIWFLVPAAGIASLLPPRVVIMAPAPVMAVLAAPASVIGHITHSTLRVTEQLTGQSALVLSMPPQTSAYQMPDTATLLFAAWALGTLLMTLYLTRLQLRFSAAARMGKAGPAVLGFFRPRIVTPDGFQERFSAQEQAAILAHEHIHLTRQDARINGLAALLRCLCWFNPLIHLGARWLRIDQELACDATAVAGRISRRDYAKALLKSQLVVTSLPLGCNWPGSQHPLVERIALLKHKPPGAARRLAGVGVVVLAATSAGLGAWAAQPPVAAKSMAAQRRMVLAARPIAVAPDQMASEPVANANSIGSGNDADTSNNTRANEAVSAAPALEPLRTVSIETRTEATLVAPPQIAPASEPSNETIADQPKVPTSEDASAESKDIVARNTTGAPPDGATALDIRRPKTEAALACLLGLARAGCETVFVGASFNEFDDNSIHGLTPYESRQIISYCAEEYIHRVLNNCPQGPLETVDRLGTNINGDDVYVAKFMHQKKTYVISQPTADGKVPAFWIFNNSSIRALQRKDLVELQAPAPPPRTIYSAER
jgi:beta-lactamase regulating signal transducer with metallopeptidase domain